MLMKVYINFSWEIPIETFWYVTFQVALLVFTEKQ